MRCREQLESLNDTNVFTMVAREEVEGPGKDGLSHRSRMKTL